MSTTKNITMKQFNGIDYDTIYPKNTSQQVLLNDSDLANSLGLTNTDPTVNDALGAVDSKAEGEVGDVKITARTDLGEDWVLCNGQCLGTNYPEVTSMLLPVNGRENIGNTIFLESSGQYYTVYNLPQYFCSVYSGNTNNRWIYVADIYSGTCSRITLDNEEMSTSYIPLGIDWNGTEWVLCAANGNSLNIYTNSIISSTGWVLQGTKTLTYIYRFGQWNRLLYNGTGYYLLTGRDSYQVEYLYYFSSLTDSNISNINSITTSTLYGNIYLHRGDDGLVSFYSATYSPTSPTSTVITNGYAGATPIWKKYNDNYYISVYAHNANSDIYPSSIYYYRPSSSAAYALYTATGKAGLPFVNKNLTTGLWEFYWYYTTTSYYYLTLESGLENISSSSVVSHGSTSFTASAPPAFLATNFINNSEPNENWTRISQVSPYFGISQEVAFAPIITNDAAYTYIRVQ